MNPPGQKWHNFPENPNLPSSSGALSSIDTNGLLTGASMDIILLMRAGHTDSLPIPDFGNSFVRISNASQENVDRAIVFIHGFDGGADTTWGALVDLVDDANYSSTWWDSADLYFYDYNYESKFRKISRNKLRIAAFINSIFPTPMEEIMSGADPSLRQDFSYKYLTLVGHSEGGLILRKVIADAATKNTDVQRYIQHFKTPQGGSSMAEPEVYGVLRAALRLFAPAIGGEAVTGLLGVLARLPFIKLGTGSVAARVSMASTSPAVSTARHLTEEYTDYLTMGCFRADIIWADIDHVIEPEKYKQDLECQEPPPETDHMSICKPTAYYLVPISFIESGL